MVFVYQGVNVEYRFIGKPSKSPTLLLHGWGCDGEEFASIIKHFDRDYLTVDFPPFGKSGKINEEWNIYTYASMIMSLCEHLHIESCDILAHSFGGRVAILISALLPEFVSSLVLVDSAGIKSKKSIKKRLNIINYKIRRRLRLNVDEFGSSDYKNLDHGTKKAFVAIVNEDLSDYCRKIDAKTLIIFGGKDKDTPIYMAKKMHRLIKNSQLIILKEGGHFSFLDCPLSFCKALDNFWEGKR